MTEVVGVMTGGAAAADRAAKDKAERDKRRSSSFNTWEFGQWKAAEPGDVYGESKVVRLATDEPDWAEAKQHSYIPTKPAPADIPEGRKWQPRFGGVCRYTLVNKRAGNGEIIRAPWYEDCYICDEVYLPGKNGKPDYHPKASPRSWAWAVEREEVLGTQEMVDAGQIESFEVGTPVSYKDVEVERQDADGKVYTDKKWILLNFAMENFFDKLLGYKNVYKTVVDRDYKITRKGAGTDTDYEIVALDPITEEIDGKQVRVDLRKDVFKARYQPPVELFDIIAKQASSEHYEWFFDTRVETTWESRFPKKEDKESSSEASGSSSETTTDEASDQHKETLNGMRERLKKERERANA